MKILNFLNNYNYYRNPCLNFIDKKVFFYKFSLILKINFNFSYIFKLEENLRDEVILDFLYSYYKKITLFENFFQRSGFLVSAYFFKGKKKIFRKSNDKLDFFFKHKFSNSEGLKIAFSRLDQNSFLSNFFLILLTFISFFNRMGEKGNLKFKIIFRRFGSVVVIKLCRDFINILSIFIEDSNSFYCHDKYILAPIFFLSEQESIFVYSYLVKNIKNIKKNGW